jgi:hypothetical protein
VVEVVEVEAEGDSFFIVSTSILFQSKHQTRFAKRLKDTRLRWKRQGGGAQDIIVYLSNSGLTALGVWDRSLQAVEIPLAILKASLCSQSWLNWLYENLNAPNAS